MSGPIRVMVVDDSVVIRRLLSTIIDDDPDLEVVGIAQNGKIALERAKSLAPDVVTLDVEMPEMDGLEALKHLRAAHPDLPIVMFSTLTERGAAATLTALSNGASDYVTKPANVGSVNVAMDRVREELIPKLKALGTPAPELTFPELERPVEAAPLSNRIDVVAIGSSTGGPNALNTVLAALPADFPVPVVVTQHMPPVFTSLLAERLNDSCHIRVVEGAPGMVLEAGTAYIAPGDYHMVITNRPLGPTLGTNQDPPVNYCRPAVDVMFNSVSEIWGGNVLAVVLTGMGADGRDGCVPFKEAGARVIAQDQRTSVVWGMPGAVASAGLADDILPLDAIGPAIVDRVRAAHRGGRVSAMSFARTAAR